MCKLKSAASYTSPPCAAASAADESGTAGAGARESAARASMAMAWDVASAFATAAASQQLPGKDATVDQKPQDDGIKWLAFGGNKARVAC